MISELILLIFYLLRFFLGKITDFLNCLLFNSNFGPGFDLGRLDLESVYFCVMHTLAFAS